MSHPPSSEDLLREVVREHITRLRQGLWGFNILMSELVDKKNWAAPQISIPEKKKRFPLAEMRAAYGRRTEHLVCENRSSSRKEDDTWAKAHGFPITVIRKFRKECAPAEWQSKGRRPSKN